jgi:aldehyde:ferredoxin oxidoreductase
MLGGYCNRVAWIDLAGGNIEYKEIKEDDARKYIGGRGLGVKYVFDNGPQVEPLSAENILCVMTGPLTGTDASMSGRLAVVTKSPLTGTITDSHMGGWTGAKLRWAGFDGLVFKGKSDKPVYAYVEDGKVTLHDASAVWGKGVHDTLRILRQKHGEECGGMAIGQAGENLVRLAGWVNVDDRAAGRTGTGAVAGFKQLKAIIIKGDRENRPRPANPEADQKARKRALEVIRDEENITSPGVGGLSTLGTNSLMNAANEIGALPTRNSQLSAYDKAELISAEHVNETIKVSDPSCHACPVACKKEVEVREGRWKVRMESLEYESAWALGANCDNPDVSAIAYMIDQCNDYGLDPIEMGNVLSVFMEATQKEYVEEEGLPWGDAEGMSKTIRTIALRQGIGDTLAEGTVRTAEAFGHPEIAMAVKGMAIPAYDPRGLKGKGIGFATSNRGACHLRAYTPAVEMDLMPFHSLKQDPLEWEGKGNLARVFQDIYAVTDSLDLCKFSSFAESMEEYTPQFNAMTGLDYTVEDLLKCGERIYNLERYYNNLNGFREGSDTLPKRFLEEPSTAPGSQGQVCELDKMLEEYYEDRGWVNGVVPESKLKELEII